MSVSSVGSTNSANQTDWRTTRQQATQDFEQLFQSLQQGNLAAAQQAYSGLQQLAPTASADSNATGTQNTVTDVSTTSPLAKAMSDWTALGQALQSGSLSSAQGDFSQLQQDLGAVHGAHHHHHHASSVSDSQGQSATSGQTTGSSSVQSDISALDKALKSGDTSSAQSVLAQLEQDLQATGSSHRHHHHQGNASDPQSAAATYATNAVQSSAGTSSVSTSA